MNVGLHGHIRCSPTVLYVQLLSMDHRVILFSCYYSKEVSTIRRTHMHLCIYLQENSVVIIHFIFITSKHIKVHLASTGLWLEFKAQTVFTV